jgi:hypothetical protein
MWDFSNSHCSLEICEVAPPRRIARWNYGFKSSRPGSRKIYGTVTLLQNMMKRINPW